MRPDERPQRDRRAGLGLWRHLDANRVRREVGVLEGHLVRAGGERQRRQRRRADQAAVHANPRPGLCGDPERAGRGSRARRSLWRRHRRGRDARFARGVGRGRRDVLARRFSRAFVGRDGEALRRPPEPLARSSVSGVCIALVAAGLNGDGRCRQRLRRRRGGAPRAAKRPTRGRRQRRSRPALRAQCPPGGGRGASGEDRRRRDLGRRRLGRRRRPRSGIVEPGREAGLVGASDGASGGVEKRHRISGATGGVFRREAPPRPPPEARARAGRRGAPARGRRGGRGRASRSRRQRRRARGP